MVRIDLAYEGELRTSCSHAPSGAELTTDAPVDNAGRGESFSPTDLLATALGSCMLTVMGIRARNEGWNIDGATSSIEKHMQLEPVRRVGRLVLVIEMPGGLSQAARETLEEVGRGCPVARSIHPDIELDVDFRWSTST
jgi:putative redox protein